MAFGSSLGVETRDVCQVADCACSRRNVWHSRFCPDGEVPADINPQNVSGEHAIKEWESGRMIIEISTVEDSVISRCQVGFSNVINFHFGPIKGSHEIRVPGSSHMMN
jgi:hypothetical protein